MQRVMASFFLCIVCTVGACGKVATPPPDSGMAELDQIGDRWNDGIDVAGHTRRNSLSGPVENLQAIRRDLQQLKVSECLGEAKTDLLRYMDGKIKVYLDFMGGGAGATPVALKTQLDAYDTARERCAASASTPSTATTATPENQLPPSAPAPATAHPQTPVLRPEETDALLVCDGNFSGNGVQNADLQATLKLETSRLGWSATFDAPRVDGAFTLEHSWVGAYNMDFGHGQRQSFEDHSTASRWDITDHDFENDAEKAIRHFVFERGTGHIQYQDTDLFHIAYDGTCHKPTSGETNVLAKDRKEQELENNPRLAIALHMPFREGQVCDTLRTQLVRFAREPQVRTIDWERFVDQITETAQQAHCLPE